MRWKTSWIQSVWLKTIELQVNKRLRLSLDCFSQVTKMILELEITAENEKDKDGERKEVTKRGTRGNTNRRKNAAKQINAQLLWYKIWYNLNLLNFFATNSLCHKVNLAE